jgi:hypothetical protein
MNRDMEEKGIVARDCLPPEPRCPPHAAVRHQRLCRGSVYFDVDVEEPESSENPTQSFEIHNIAWRRTQLLAVIIYIIIYIITA